MKKHYIQPNASFDAMEAEQLMTGSVNNVGGVEDISVSNEEFKGGNADSRKTIWDDDEF